MRLILAIALCVCFAAAVCARNVRIISGSPPSGSLDSNVITYHTNVVANGGTISSEHLLAINRYVTNEYAIGSWAYSLDESPLAGTTTNAAVVKLKIGANSPTNLTIVGSFAAAAIYDQSLGWKGQNNFYLNTRFAASNLFNFGICGMEFWNSSYFSNAVKSGSAGMMGYDYAEGAPRAIMLLDETADGLSQFTRYHGASGIDNAYKISMGLIGSLRTATNRAYGTINGRISKSDTSAEMTTNMSANATFKLNNPGWFGGDKYGSDINYAFYRIDSGMPSNMIYPHWTNVAYLMQQLGRVPNSYPRKLVVVSGQSLATGTTSAGGTTTAQNSGSVFDNVQLFERALFGDYDATDYQQFIRTKTHESITGSGYGTTGWKAFQDELSALSRTNGWGATNDSLLMNYAVGGAGPSYFVTNSASTLNYAPAGDIAFTTNRFFATVTGVERQVAFEAALSGRTLAIPFMVIRNGETDCGDSTFGTTMLGWQSSQETHLKIKTGQASSIPFLVSQQFACTNIESNTNFVFLHENHRSAFTLVGPKYQFQMYSTDGTHLTNYDQLGELEGKAAEALIRSGWFEPLRVVDVQRSGAVITCTVTNYGNFGMVLDSNTIPFVADLGITYTDDGTPPAISSIALAGATTNQITVTLASTPSGSNKRIRFGYPISGMVSSGGWTNRPRTNIRNACTNIGISSGLNIWDWMVQHERTVP